MASYLHFYIFFPLLYLKLSSACSDGECRKLTFPAFFFFADKRLVNHNITTVQVPDKDVCELMCYHEHNCVSINFENKVSATGIGYNCDLNNSTHRGHDEDFVDAKGYFYHGADSACDTAHCKNGGTCQSGFTDKRYRCLCPPGFSGEHCELVIGVDCEEIKKRGVSKGDGMYLLDPDGGSHSNAFLAFCDMTSYGGGWTMCYTTDEYAKPKTEVTYSARFPYGNDGYMTNCNNIPFKEIIFIDHETGNKAYFKRRTQMAITAAGNYGKVGGTYGLWDGVGSMESAYSYQLLICDTSFYSGFFVSGYTRYNNSDCYKQCNHWCGDGVSPYFRTASTNTYFQGVAFNKNGHSSLDNRLMSVGLR